MAGEKQQFPLTVGCNTFAFKQLQHAESVSIQSRQNAFDVIG